MKTRLTPLAVDRMKPGTERKEVPDGGCPGLYLVIQKTGTKSWAIRARIYGKPTKITIGQHPQLDLLTAREKAREALALVDAAIDPRQQLEEEQQQREEEERRRDEEQRCEKANTLRAVAEQFRDKHMKRARAKSWKDSWSALDRYVLYKLGDRPIESIRRRDMHEILDELADKPGTWHHVVSAVSSLFRWALDREIIDANPVAALPRPKAGVRERALTDAEIPVAWKVAEAVSYPYGPLVRLLLMTGCRRGEIAGLRWSEVDLVQNTITIPSDRYKTGQTLVVPLSPLARQLIENLPRHAGGEYVFSTTGGRRPISGYSKMMRRFDAALAKHCECAEIEPFDFDLHDLRRTFRTNMSALKVPPHLAEALLGHVVTGVQKRYDKWTYIDEKREAVELWARKVQSLIEPGSNVRPLPQRRISRGSRR